MSFGKCQEVTVAAEVELARELVVEYAKGLGCSPCLATIEKELGDFPQPFAPPRGLLLIAIENGEAAGVVGVKELREQTAEMCRLYVRPEFRGRNLGRLLAEQALAGAKGLGNNLLRLYTLPTMSTALAMYRRLGFYEIEPYVDHPIPGGVYLEKDLTTLTGTTHAAGTRR